MDAAGVLLADRRPASRSTSPSWQASISEQVTADHLPAAVALGTISYNVARSFGPAIGGLIVLAVGREGGVRASTRSCYLPLCWRSCCGGASTCRRGCRPSGWTGRSSRAARYVLPFAGAIRTVMTRAFLFGLAGATAAALAPLVAKDLLARQRQHLRHPARRERGRRGDRRAAGPSGRVALRRLAGDPRSWRWSAGWC